MTTTEQPIVRIKKTELGRGNYRNMCALGHYLKALGHPTDLARLPLPQNDPRVSWLYEPDAADKYAPVWWNIVSANDPVSPDYAAIVTIFADNGVTVIFED